MARKVRIGGLMPKPKKVGKRGVYELLSIATGGNTKVRDYGKRLKTGKF